MESACDAAAGQLDQVLLQRRDAERVLDVIVVQRAVGTIGAHDELAVTAREGRGDAAVAEPRVAEITDDADVRRRLHGEVVVRLPPALGRLLVALATHRLSDITRRPPRQAPRVPPPATGRDGEGGDDRAGTDDRCPEAPGPGKHAVYARGWRYGVTMDQLRRAAALPLTYRPLGPARCRFSMGKSMGLWSEATYRLRSAIPPMCRRR